MMAAIGSGAAGVATAGRGAAARASDDPPTWRLLLHAAADGPTNMAIDEALMACFRPGMDRPVLRLYAWSPPCLSLGRGQAWEEIDHAACRSRGITVVRRASGGRAVLHDRELTYAVVASTDDALVGGTIARSYAAIAAGLVAGARALGAAADLAPAPPRPDRVAQPRGACFVATARHEITHGGRKLIGSAQVRRRGVLLQHGSLLLDGDQAAVADLLCLAPAARAAARADLRVSATSVAAATGRAWTPAAAAPLVAAAVAAALHLTLLPDGLTAAEADQAARGPAEWVADGARRP